MSRDSTIQIRIDSDLKETAMRIVDTLGDRSLSDVVNTAIKDFVDANRHVLNWCGWKEIPETTECFFDAFDLRSHANTVAFVMGQTGSGKTTWAKQFLEKQNQFGHRTVVLDFFRDYAGSKEFVESGNYRVVDVSLADPDESAFEGNVILDFTGTRIFTGGPEPVIAKYLSALAGENVAKGTVFLVDELYSLHSYDPEYRSYVTSFLSSAVLSGGSVVSMTQQPEMVVQEDSLLPFFEKASVKLYLSGSSGYFKCRNSLGEKISLSEEAIEFLGRSRERGSGIMVTTSFKPIESLMLGVYVSEEGGGASPDPGSFCCLEKIDAEYRFSFGQTNRYTPTDD